MLFGVEIVTVIIVTFIVRALETSLEFTVSYLTGIQWFERSSVPLNRGTPGAMSALPRSASSASNAGRRKGGKAAAAAPVDDRQIPVLLKRNLQAKDLEGLPYMPDYRLAAIGAVLLILLWSSAELWSLFAPWLLGKSSPVDQYAYVTIIAIVVFLLYRGSFKTLFYSTELKAIATVIIVLGLILSSTVLLIGGDGAFVDVAWEPAHAALAAWYRAALGRYDIDPASFDIITIGRLRIFAVLLSTVISALVVPSTYQYGVIFDSYTRLKNNAKTSEGAKGLSILTVVNFLAPLIIILLWIRPAARDLLVFDPYVHPSVHKHSYPLQAWQFETARLALTALVLVLRFTQVRQVAQIHMYGPVLVFSEFGEINNPQPITIRKFAQKIQFYYATFGAVLAQYVSNVVLLCALALSLKRNTTEISYGVLSVLPATWRIPMEQGIARVASTTAQSITNGNVLPSLTPLWHAIAAYLLWWAALMGFIGSALGMALSRKKSRLL